MPPISEFSRERIVENEILPVHKQGKGTLTVRGLATKLDYGILDIVLAIVLFMRQMKKQ